eukprot:GHVP01062734.1.p1 GENE.GHVP01062734.1~~GHVP01062734.1.p1  ORF type:complete len:211 (+),score=28.52 GHVP01062734.1:866-1498(+)
MEKDINACHFFKCQSILGWNPEIAASACCFWSCTDRGAGIENDVGHLTACLLLSCKYHEEKSNISQTYQLFRSFKNQKCLVSNEEFEEALELTFQAEMYILTELNFDLVSPPFYNYLYGIIYEEPPDVANLALECLEAVLVCPDLIRLCLQFNKSVRDRGGVIVALACCFASKSYIHKNAIHENGPFYMTVLFKEALKIARNHIQQKKHN